MPAVVFMLSQRRSVPLLIATLVAALVAADLLLLRVSEGRPEHFPLGLVVPINLVVLAVVSFWSLFPLYGVPTIILLVAERPGIALLWIVPVVARVLLIRSAFDVHGVLTEAGHPGRWRTGLAASPALLLGGLSPALAVVWVNWHPGAPAAAPAVQAARAIERCARRFAADSSGRFPIALSELGPSGSGCLDAAVAGGHVPGWSVTFHGGRRLTLLVRERGLPLATYRSYLSDESGVLRSAGYARRDATTADPVLANVTVELQQLRDCMTRLRQTSSRRLPGSLWSMSQWRSRCYVLNDARWRVDGDSNVAEIRTRFRDNGSIYEEQYRYIYLPYAAPDGRIDSAAIAARPAVYGVTGVRSYVLAPSGEIRATPRDRPALPTDPPIVECESYSLSACQRTATSWTTVKPPADSVTVPAVGTLWQVALATRPASGSFTRPPAPLITRAGLIVATGQMGTFAYSADGTKRWSRRDLGVGQGGAAAGPAGTILVADSTGTVHALDRAGRDVWSARLGVPTHLQPVVAGNTIYVAGDHALFALTPTGDVRWRRALAGLADDLVAARDGGIYVDLWGDHNVLEHLTADGRADAVAPRDSLRPCAGAEGGGGGGGGSSLDACAGGVRARLDPESRRRFALIQEELTPHVRDELLWLWQLDRDGTAFVVSDGALRAVGRDRATRWRVPPGPATPLDRDGFTVTPGGYVVVETGRKLTAFDRIGTACWRADLPSGALYSRPAADAAGIVYVVGTDWMLYAVRPPGPARNAAPGKSSPPTSATPHTHRSAAPAPAPTPSAAPRRRAGG